MGFKAAFWRVFFTALAAIAAPQVALSEIPGTFSSPPSEHLLREVIQSLFPNHELRNRVALLPGESTPRMQLVSPSGDKILVLVLTSSNANAYAIQREFIEDVHAIVLTNGLLRILKTRSELAFVLAHEVAHIKHDHFSTHLPLAMLTPSQRARIDDVHQKWEHTADREALKLLAKRGFDTAHAITILLRLEHHHHQESTSNSYHGSHPRTEHRIQDIASRLIQPES